MISGVGVDVVDIARLASHLAAIPRLRERLFTPAERGLAMDSLAARFAAKEAVAKALGAPEGWSWQDITVEREHGARPRVVLSGVTAAVAGATRLSLSLSHDGGVAVAFVVAETAPGTAGGQARA